MMENTSPTAPRACPPANGIRFYRVHEPYGCFSNFAPCPVTVDGKEWPMSEHYFQAQKFHDEVYQESIRTAKSPKEAGATAAAAATGTCSGRS